MFLLTFLHTHAVALYILLAGLGLGAGALRLLRLPARGMERLWLAWVTGLGALSVGTLLLGMAGLLHAWVFGLLLAPCALGGALALGRSGIARSARAWLAWRNAPSFRIVAYLLLALSVGSVLWIWLTHALMPPHEWDEVAYHLTLPKLYVEAHSIYYIPFIVQSNWPMNSEMLFVLALIFGSDIVAHVLMLSTVLLTALGLLVVSRHFFDDRVGIVAVAIFVTVPLVKRLAGTGLVDVAPGLYVLAALVAFDYWRQRQQWQWLALCGILSGFAAGTKLMGGAFPLLFGFLVLVVELRHRPRLASSVLAHITVFGVAGLLVAGPWYVRSWLLTGNPIWPFAYSVFGGRDWDALGSEYLNQLLVDVLVTHIPRTPLGLVQSFVYLVSQPSALGDYRGGIGVIIPVGALFASVLVWRTPPILRWALAVCAGFYVLWFFLVSHQARFLLPVVPLGALAAAYLFVWLYRQMRLSIMRFALLTGMILLVLHVWPWSDQGERALLAARLPYLRGEQTRAAWLDMQIDSMPMFRYANTQLPSEVKILLLPYENRTYYLDRPYVWGNPISQRIIAFEQFDSAPALAAHLRRLGITHVIDNPAWSYDGTRYWQHDRALMLALRNQCGETLMRQGVAELYALKDCAD